MLDRIKQEPARVVGLVVAVLALLAAFGVQLTTEQETAIEGVIAAVLILGGAEITRSKVTPTSRARGKRAADE